jgi:hypothetical protein
LKSNDYTDDLEMSDEEFDEWFNNFDNKRFTKEIDYEDLTIDDLLFGDLSDLGDIDEEKDYGTKSLIYSQPPDFDEYYQVFEPKKTIIQAPYVKLIEPGDTDSFVRYIITMKELNRSRPTVPSFDVLYSKLKVTMDRHVSEKFDYDLLKDCIFTDKYDKVELFKKKRRLIFNDNRILSDYSGSQEFLKIFKQKKIQEYLRNSRLRNADEITQQILSLYEENPFITFSEMMKVTSLKRTPIYNRLKELDITLLEEPNKNYEKIKRAIDYILSNNDYHRIHKITIRLIEQRTALGLSTIRRFYSEYPDYWQKVSDFNNDL